MKNWIFTRARRPGPQQDARYDGFCPTSEWLAEVRAVAANDLRDGGSGRYGVFRNRAGTLYFERWQPTQTYVWEYQASAPEERMAA